MNKACIEIGYAISEDLGNGIWQEKITAIQYRCDLTNNYLHRQENNNSTNDNISFSTKYSILGDNFAFNNFGFMKYVEHNGIKWAVSNVYMAYPRLVITVGGLYNGE